METCLPMKSVALVLTTGNREKINQTRAENKIGQVGPCYEKRAGNSCTKRKPKLKVTVQMRELAMYSHCHFVFVSIIISRTDGSVVTVLHIRIK